MEFILISEKTYDAMVAGDTNVPTTTFKHVDMIPRIGDSIISKTIKGIGTVVGVVFNYDLNKIYVMVIDREGA